MNAGHAGRCLFILDTNVLMHDPTAIFRFQEHDVFLPMMVLEALDQGPHALHVREEVELGLGHADPEPLGVADLVQAVRRLQEGLGRHAPAENAQPAQLLGRVHGQDLGAGLARHPRRAAARGPAADHHHVVVEVAHRRSSFTWVRC